MLRLEVYAQTDVGRRRTNNEDFLGDLLVQPDSDQLYDPAKVQERGQLFAVADGMGGHAHGEVASQMVVTSLFHCYYNAPGKPNLAINLAEAVSTANLNVYVAGLGGFMGTTLTLALFVGNRALVGNIGDSRTYLLRQGILNQITRDHSLVQEQVEQGILTPSQAEKSPIRNYITRSIGQEEEVDVDYFEVVLQPDDLFLLCSDGLYGQLHSAEIISLISKATSLEEATKQLINLVNERGGPDNISLLLVRVLEIGEDLSPLLSAPSVTVRLKGKTEEITSPSAPAKTTVAKNSVEPLAPTKDVFVPNATKLPVSKPTLKSDHPKSKKLFWFVVIASLGGAGIIIAAILLFFSLQPSSSTTSATPTPAFLSTNVPVTIPIGNIQSGVQRGRAVANIAPSVDRLRRVVKAGGLDLYSLFPSNLIPS